MILSYNDCFFFSFSNVASLNLLVEISTLQFSIWKSSLLLSLKVLQCLSYIVKRKLFEYHFPIPIDFSHFFLVTQLAINFTQGAFYFVALSEAIFAFMDMVEIRYKSYRY